MPDGPDRVLFNRALLRDAQRKVARTFHEHILVYTCDEPAKQVWQWSVRLPDGRKLRHREHPFFSKSSPPAFVNRLQGLRFTLDEEESVGLVDALDRVRRVLDTSAELNLFARKPKYAEKSDELFQRVRSGDPEAFGQFIVMHWPLARHMSKRYARWYNLDPDDAEQIAVTGLIRAVQKYRPETGCQFSTYATWWIRQACMRQGPQEAFLIRIRPDHVWPLLQACRTHDAALVAGGPLFARDCLERYLNETPELQKNWLRLTRAISVRSLSDRLQPEWQESRLIPDSRLEPPVATERSELAGLVRGAIDRMRPRYSQFLRLRHGIDGEPMTLEEIGQLAGITRERVRQILVKAELRLCSLLKDHVPELSQRTEDNPPTDAPLVRGRDQHEDTTRAPNGSGAAGH